LLLIPQVGVAVRRLNDLGKTGRELVVPCVMIAAVRWPSRFAASCPRSWRWASSG